MSGLHSPVATLYFEAHITINPVFDERRALATTIAEKHKFRLAKLIMRKRVSDFEVESQDDTFMTGRGRYLSEMIPRIKSLLAELNQNGFLVLRCKIEDTIFDTRFDFMESLDDFIRC